MERRKLFMNIHAFREKRRNILCQLRIISLHPIYVRVILRDSQSNIPFLSRSPSQTWGFLAGFSRIETICPHFSSSFLLLLFLPSLLSLFLFFLFLFFLLPWLKSAHPRWLSHPTSIIMIRG